MAHPDFNDSYTGTPPWDIGGPQPSFLALAREGALTGRVLDVGCGTGEHVLLAAGQGLAATGVDMAPRAIAAAEDKARERGIPARFLVHDALRLHDLGERFDTVLDCGLFHVLGDEDRVSFASSLHQAMEPGAIYFMLCFSEREPGTWGPRRVTRDEIRQCFAEGWRVHSIEPAALDTTFPPPAVQGWLARIARL